MPAWGASFNFILLDNSFLAQQSREEEEEEEAEGANKVVA